MKRLALVASVFALLALPSFALAGGSITGTYTTKITTPAQFKGTWALTFAKAGTYAISERGTVVVRGHYVSAGSQLTFSKETGPLACPKVGSYTWKRAGTKLAFTRKSDACTGRSYVLGHPFVAGG
jgi:hypothetical protein